MSKLEQAPTIVPETEEQRGYRKSKEVMEIFREAAQERSAPTPKKPGLDYYDNKRDTKEDGTDIPYSGRYGKFENDDDE